MAPKTRTAVNDALEHVAAAVAATGETWVTCSEWDAGARVWCYVPRTPGVSGAVGPRPIPKVLQ